MDGDTFLRELLLLLPFFILHMSRFVEDHRQTTLLLYNDSPCPVVWAVASPPCWSSTTRGWTRLVAAAVRQWGRRWSEHSKTFLPYWWPSWEVSSSSCSDRGSCWSSRPCPAWCPGSWWPPPPSPSRPSSPPASWPASPTVSSQATCTSSTLPAPTTSHHSKWWR